MEDIVARRAAELLLAEHKASIRFKPLGPPDAMAERAAVDLRAVLLISEYEHHRAHCAT